MWVGVPLLCGEPVNLTLRPPPQDKDERSHVSLPESVLRRVCPSVLGGEGQPLTPVPLSTWSLLGRVWPGLLQEAHPPGLLSLHLVLTLKRFVKGSGPTAFVVHANGVLPENPKKRELGALQCQKSHLNFGNKWKHSKVLSRCGASVGFLSAWLLDNGPAGAGPLAHFPPAEKKNHRTTVATR